MKEYSINLLKRSGTWEILFTHRNSIVEVLDRIKTIILVNKLEIITIEIEWIPHFEEDEKETE